MIEAIKSLKNKIMTMIQRTVITISKPVKPGEFSTYQVKCLGKITEVENISPYGLVSTPPVNASGIKLNIQGESSNQVGIAYAPITFPTLRENGEAAIGAFSAISPTYLKFTHEGRIEIWKNGILVISDLITHLHSGVTTGAGISGPPIL